jgi:hypothetical protein
MNCLFFLLHNAMCTYVYYYTVIISRAVHLLYWEVMLRDVAAVSTARVMMLIARVNPLAKRSKLYYNDDAITVVLSHCLFIQSSLHVVLH